MSENARKIVKVPEHIYNQYREIHRSVTKTAAAIIPDIISWADLPEDTHIESYGIDSSDRKYTIVFSHQFFTYPDNGNPWSIIEIDWKAFMEDRDRKLAEALQTATLPSAPDESASSDPSDTAPWHQTLPAVDVHDLPPEQTSVTLINGRGMEAAADSIVEIWEIQDHPGYHLRFRRNLGDGRQSLLKLSLSPAALYALHCLIKHKLSRAPVSIINPN